MPLGDYYIVYLLAPCRSALQLLLDTCESYGLSWCLSYNPSKSKVMSFGKNSVSPPFTMYGNSLDFVQEYKYLGVIVVAGKQSSVSHLKPLIRFQSVYNTVLNVQQKPSENILMKLLYSTCVPVMTYTCEANIFTAKQINCLNVALNDSIHRIFGYNRWESIRYLRLTMGYPSMTDILTVVQTLHETSRSLAILHCEVSLNLFNIVHGLIIE